MFGGSKPSFGSSPFGGSSNTGGGGLFGQNKSTSIFGQSSTNTSANTSGGIFGGAQKPATSSLFGGGTNTQSGSIFGSSTPQNTSSSLFGGGQQKSIFGSSTPQSGSTNLFGQSTTNTTGGGSLFGGGTTTSNTGGGLFGSTASTVNGTTVKFEPPIGQDTMMRNGSSQNIATKHMCITAMKQYETKSIEELRVEDYMANRKTPGTGTTSGTGLFGSSTTTSNTSGGLFGTTQQQQQQQQNKPLFGSTTTSSPFGGQASTGGSLFGNTQANTSGGSLFGQKPATGGSLFGGASTTTNAFGASTTGTSLFGNTQQTTNTFGQPQQQGASLFGNTATSTAGTSLFGGQPQQQSSFSFGGGTATTNTFGQPAASTGGMFGSTAPATATSGGLFGKPAQPSGFTFGGSSGATNTTFGQPAATGGGLFGNTANKPLFGSTTTNTTGGGLFGTQPATGGGIFGANTNQAQPAATGFGVVQPQQQVAAPVVPIGTVSEAQQLQTSFKAVKSQLITMPYGDSPLLKFCTDEIKNEEESTLSTSRQMRFLSAKKPVVTDDLKKSNFLPNNIPKLLGDMSPAVRSPEARFPNDLNYTSTQKPPTLGRGLGNGLNNSSVLNKSVLDGTIVNKSVDASISAALNGSNNLLGSRGRRTNLKALDLSVLEVLKANDTTTASERVDDDALPVLTKDTRNTNAQNDVGVVSPSLDPLQAYRQRNQNRQQNPPQLNLDTTAETVVTTEEPTQHSASEVSKISPTSNLLIAAGVTILQSDYYSIPTIAAMADMVEDGKVVLPNGLTIGRSGFGSVFWPGKIALKDLVLDEVVVFRHREVTVYPNEEKKAPEGTELNRPAEVTLERVWLVDRKTKQEIKDPLILSERGWREHLERSTLRMGALFKDYRPDSGSWVFAVEHFSKYGLADDDECEPMPAATAPAAADRFALQDMVQRAPLARSPLALKPPSEAPPAPGLSAARVSHEMPLLDAHLRRSGGVINGQTTVKEGLGGGLLQVAAEEQRLNRTFELQDDDQENKMNFEVPEKKPKLELANIEFEADVLLKKTIGFAAQLAAKCVTAVRSFDGGVSEKETIGYKKSNLIDLAVLAGRSARIGWSAAGTLAWSGQPSSNEVLISTIDREGVVPIETMCEMIDANVAASVTSRDNESAAARVVYEGDYADLLRLYSEIASRGEHAEQVHVWKLCEALFPTERLSGWELQRADDVGDWLVTEAKQHEKNVQCSSDAYGRIWKALCIGNREEAFQEAVRGGRVTLASSLFAFLVSPEDTAPCYRQQIELYEQSGVLHTLDTNLLKIYLLLAGQSHKTWKQNGKTHSVNCLEGLHWSQALGIHVWYLRNWGGLEDAFDSYLEDVSAGRAQKQDEDLRGELIKLACMPQHAVESVIDAVEAPENDYFFKWHLWSILSFVGFKSMSRASEHRLHVAYSSQIERAQPHLAVFVLSHISNTNCRTTAIRQLLDRVAPSVADADWDAIAQTCDVPQPWIAAAKFALAMMNGNIGGAFELALVSGQYREAQSLFVNDVAPLAVVTSDMDTLGKACQLIEPHAHSISEWGMNGQVYCDYYRLKNLDDDDMQNFEDIVESIEMRIRAPVFKSTIQKQSLYTLARVVFECKKETDIGAWKTLLGPRQYEKMLRDTASLYDPPHTIDFL